MKNKKNPWIAAVLNFLLPGLGYIYGGKKRKFYSWGLFLLSILVGIHDWDEIVGVFMGRGVSAHFVLFIILYPLVFAWDAYKDVTEEKTSMNQSI